MTVHIIRLAVGVTSVDHLSELQKTRLKEARKTNGRKARLMTFTRNRPRRADELTDGGSLYWVVKGIIRVRQRILGVEEAVNAEGRACCALVLDPKHTLTVPRAKRAFQGWRYYAPEEAPLDLDKAGLDAFTAKDGNAPPAELLAELKELGLV